jgi:hypothetical protein
MKIHSFLSNNFIINCNTTNYNSAIVPPTEYLYKINTKTGKYEMLDFDYDMSLDN